MFPPWQLEVTHHVLLDLLILSQNHDRHMLSRSHPDPVNHEGNNHLQGGESPDIQRCSVACG